MNCLECSTAASSAYPKATVGCCAYCGAGVCLDHVIGVTVRRQPTGVIPQSQAGARRLACSTCYAAINPGQARNTDLQQGPDHKDSSQRLAVAVL
ncbi:DUF2180 family protein [Actinacidiphila soli]|jgi:hypothetical protein|uniref:DUF2180 family protein n=1 Tax=Actinacidiphila soli TaxID=2487275 RepID=UPI000FCA6E74|nr:DUF2180 family protein [Actinacidiphila soli]